jgi:hypothetical protein
MINQYFLFLFSVLFPLKFQWQNCKLKFRTPNLLRNPISCVANYTRCSRCKTIQTRSLSLIQTAHAQNSTSIIASIKWHVFEEEQMHVGSGIILIADEKHICNIINMWRFQIWCNLKSSGQIPSSSEFKF